MSIRMSIRMSVSQKLRASKRVWLYEAYKYEVLKTADTELPPKKHRKNIRMPPVALKAVIIAAGICLFHLGAILLAAFISPDVRYLLGWGGF